MQNNRALEFLNEAHGLLNDWRNLEQAQLLVRLAMDEVQELLDRLAALEGGPRDVAQASVPVLIAEVQRMTPAFLTARPRAALPGNGKGL